MPPQYSGHDYVRCMIEGDDALWCTAWNIIKPNRSNPIWNVIERYSNDTKRHFRHDLVQSSTCINWCKKELEGLDEEYLKSLDEPLFEFNGIVSWSTYRRENYYETALGPHFGY